MTGVIMRRICSVAVAALTIVFAMPTHVSARTTDLTVDMPEKVSITHAYEWVPWIIGGPNVDQLDDTSVIVEDATTRDYVEDDFYWREQDGPPEGQFQVYDTDFKPGLQRVWLQGPEDSNGNPLTSSDDYFTIKFGSRPHLHVARSGDRVTLQAAGHRWVPFEDWKPFHTIVRFQRLTSTGWVPVAHRTLVHGLASVSFTRHRAASYRIKLLGTANVWGSHSHTKSI